MNEHPLLYLRPTNCYLERENYANVCENSEIERNILDLKLVMKLYSQSSKFCSNITKIAQYFFLLISVSHMPSYVYL